MSTETLQINRKKALDAYRGADASGKLILETLLGKDALTISITERVTTMQDVCQVTGRDYDAFMKDMNSLAPHAAGYLEICAIAEALNEGWVRDYSNSNQYKYYPWYKYQKGSSGRGLSFSGLDCGRSCTAVGPRLVFKSADLVHYAVKTFPNSFDKYFNQ